MLVKLASGRAPGLMGVANMEIERSPLFGGRKVDLRTPEDLSRYFRQEVLDRADIRHAQG
ncbi:MAG: hypothetical protein OXD36_00220 [Rhodobacter sp.]|nr:hypothetical protein [Rhodobacter sp.]MCY4240149.1 hypothetical protein [Rhodobacter sp.]